MHTKRLTFLALLTLGLAPLCPMQAQTVAPQVITRPTLTALHSFAYVDGQAPQFALTVGADGALYGVAPFGGLGNSSDGGGGTVFKVTQGGLFHKLADLYQHNGIYPSGPLLLLPDGSLMGAASDGGKSGTGALFLLTPPHRFQTKHEFAAVGPGARNTRGAVPQGALALGPDGAVYGTTLNGGANGRGVAYRWTAARGIEVLHDFTADAGAAPGDGAGIPAGGVTLGPDGALYGVTFGRQASHSGIVYRLTTDGLFTTLHVFTAQEGTYFTHAPVAGPDGTLYGIANGGGTGCGTVYRLAPNGDFTLLHTFTGGSDSQAPSGLTLGPDGTLYGTTEGKIPDGGGNIFRLTPNGQLTTLYAFSPGSGFGSDGTPSDGVSLGGVVFGPHGALYGSTFNGGQYKQGSIYKLRLPY